MTESYVTHTDLVSFSGQKVNIPSEYLKEYREQVKRLIDNVNKHINEHPDYNFV